MARIDRFLQQLVKVEARQLVLESDKKATLVTAGGVWPVTTVAMTAAQVRSFLEEILPSDYSRVPGAAGPLEFDYSSTQGVFRGTLSEEAGVVRLLLQPSAGQPAVVPSTVPDPAPAPVASEPTSSSRSGSPPAVLALFGRMVAEGCS